MHKQTFWLMTLYLKPFTPSIYKIEDVLNESLVLAKEDAEAAWGTRCTCLPLTLCSCTPAWIDNSFCARSLASKAPYKTCGQNTWSSGLGPQSLCQPVYDELLYKYHLQLYLIRVR